jgi:hypothetical protein
MEEPVAKFIVSVWRDKVNSGIGLSYRPAKLHRLAGRYDNPICRNQLYPTVRDYEFGLSTGEHCTVDFVLIVTEPASECVCVVGGGRGGHLP